MDKNRIQYSISARLFKRAVRLLELSSMQAPDIIIANELALLISTLAEMTPTIKSEEIIKTVLAPALTSKILEEGKKSYEKNYINGNEQDIKNWEHYSINSSIETLNRLFIEKREH